MDIVARPPDVERSPRTAVNIKRVALFRRAQRLRSSALQAVALLLLVAKAGAYQFEPSIYCDPKSGVDIKIQMPFKVQPRSGFFPMHLHVANDTGAGRSWTLDFRSLTPGQLSARYHTEIAVGAHQTRDFDLLIPWPTMESANPSYYNVNVTLAGYGVVSGNFQLTDSYASGYGTGTVAIADPLGSSVWSALETHVRGASASLSASRGLSGLAEERFSGIGRSTSRALRGSPIRLEELPADARALSGVTALWIGAAEWRGLTGPRRVAIRQWVTEGGQLFLAGLAPPALAGLPASILTQDSVPLGLGEIRKVNLENTTLPIEETATRIFDLDHAPLPAWEQDYKENWSLRSSVGAPKLNIPLLIIFVCAFGLLVGPVNLLWLAPPSKRYRLFFTVPILSACASALLLGLIAFGDGMGGDGARNVLLLVPAGENRLTLFQEQVVRSRLLLQRAFQMPESAVVTYLPLGREGAPVSLAREGTSLTGDWFRTRSVQGLTMRQSIPSRGEVVLRPGATPELLSTLSSKLQRVFFVDGTGHYWSAAELSTGRPEKLKASSEQEFRQWSQQAKGPLSSSMRAQFEGALGRPGYFYAEAVPSGENTLATLRAIRWNDQRILCLGSCIPEGTP